MFVPSDSSCQGPPTRREASPYAHFYLSTYPLTRALGPKGFLQVQLFFFSLEAKFRFRRETWPLGSPNILLSQVTAFACSVGLSEFSGLVYGTSRTHL